MLKSIEELKQEKPVYIVYLGYDDLGCDVTLEFESFAQAKKCLIKYISKYKEEVEESPQDYYISMYSISVD